MRTRTRWSVLVWCLLFGARLPHHGFADPGPPGDCSRAATPIDRLVCRDPELAALDLRLAATYGSALAVHRQVGDARGVRRLRESQRKWAAERSECVNTANPVGCVGYRYELRIAKLQVEYAMVPEERRVVYLCDGDPEDRVVATYFATNRPTVRLQRGERNVVAGLFRFRSGSRYLADGGVSFQTEGDAATIEWPPGDALHCRAHDAE